MASTNGLEGVNSAQKMIAMDMMQKVLKSSFGDGIEFEMVYQSLLDSMKDDTSQTSKTLNGLLGSDEDQGLNAYSAANISAGQDLEALPLELDGQLGFLNYSSYLNGLNLNNISEVSTTSNDANMKKIYESVNKYCSQYGVDPNLVIGVIKAESNFNPKAISSVGAKGLMQLMPSVCQDTGVSNPFDIDQNIKGGVKLLKANLERYNGDAAMALMAYNAGPGTVKARGVSSVADLYKMPAETQNYVKKIMNSYSANV
jgi:soluble lytic murein transglycosylase-like protein